MNACDYCRREHDFEESCKFCGAPIKRVCGSTIVLPPMIYAILLESMPRLRREEHHAAMARGEELVFHAPNGYYRILLEKK